MDNSYSQTLSKLINSKSPVAKLFAVAIAFTFLGPPVFRTMGNPDLTPWERAEQLTVAVGQMLFTLAFAAVNPKALGAGDDEEQTGEQE